MEYIFSITSKNFVKKILNSTEFY